MLRETECNIKRYAVEYFEGFILETEDKGDLVDFWLGHEKIGIKSYMFGLLKEYAPTMEEMLQIAVANLPNYIDNYNEDYMDGAEYFETENRLRVWRRLTGECDEDELEETCGCCPYCVNEAVR